MFRRSEHNFIFLNNVRSVTSQFFRDFSEYIDIPVSTSKSAQYQK